MFAKLLTATAIAVIGCLNSLASAQTSVDNYPDRNVRIVVPFAAGGESMSLRALSRSGLACSMESRLLSRTKWVQRVSTQSSTLELLRTMVTLCSLDRRPRFQCCLRLEPTCPLTI